MTSNSSGFGLQAEAQSRETTRTNNENANPLGQFSNVHLNVIPRAGRVLERVNRHQGDRAIVENIKWIATTGAEIAAGRVSMPTLVAEHIRHCSHSPVSARYASAVSSWSIIEASSTRISIIQPSP